MKKTTLFVINKEEGWMKKLKNHLLETDYNILTSKTKNGILNVFYEYNTNIDYIIIAEPYPDYEISNIIQTIRSYSDIPIFMLSENVETEIQMMYYRAGVDDYLPYNYPIELLVIKLEKMKRRLYGKNEVIEEGILEINSFRKKIKVEGKEVSITAKEFELLYYLVCHKKAIQTRDQILTAVWGINYMGNDRVVDSLVKKLRNKIGKAASYIKTVYAMGYYFEAPDSID